MQTDNQATILVVDDEPLNIDILVEALRNEYRLKIARNGEAALHIAHTDPKPDLILLDIMMPEMDGFSVCRRLKADPHTRDIPVIFISAKNQCSDEELGLELGANDYIVKPFKIDSVKARARNQLRIKRQADDLIKSNLNPIPEKIQADPDIYY